MWITFCFAVTAEIIRKRTGKFINSKLLYNQLNVAWNTVYLTNANIRISSHTFISHICFMWEKAKHRSNRMLLMVCVYDILFSDLLSSKFIVFTFKNRFLSNQCPLVLFYTIDCEQIGITMEKKIMKK